MRPAVYRDGHAWVISWNGRIVAARPTWQTAIEHADRLATGRARRQFARDLARIARVLESMAR